jgi:hypothetical protein
MDAGLQQLSDPDFFGHGVTPFVACGAVPAAAL